MRISIWVHSFLYVIRRASVLSFFEYRRMVSGTKRDALPLFGRRLREARELAGIAQDKLGVLISAWTNRAAVLESVATRQVFTNRL